MAKSLRSKRQRKMRAIKRVRYGEKELARLKKMLETEDETVERVDVTRHRNREQSTTTSTEKSQSPEGQKMEVDNNGKSEPKKARKSGTLMDENGSFPVWMHPRQRKKMVKKLKSKKKHSKKKA
ncbi:protein LLP homolog isoform X2 [Brevipalpus obovatus]|uniref:protein LLP homolog isoform X2 n=1 Tax=Brevipalpus obovatus TaxID=246614 RepID=UPI003D9E2350